MPHLRSLPHDAVLLDVFKRYPDTALPLLEYHQALMRGDSPLTVAQRELIAALVSSLNGCGYCHGVHAATARVFGVADGVLEALVHDVDTAPVNDRLRPLLRFVRKLTMTPARVTPADANEVFAAGWTEHALHDTVSVCALFNFMNRFVDGLGITADREYFRLASSRLSEHGYVGLVRKVKES